MWSCNNTRIEEQLKSIARGEVVGLAIEMEYPRTGAIFPPELPAPLFSWQDSYGPKGRWTIQLVTSEGTEVHRAVAATMSWRPDQTVWDEINKVSGHDSIYLTILGAHKKMLKAHYSSCRTAFSISADSVGAPIFYRAVPLPFGYAVKNVHEIEWYLGSVRGGKPQKVLDNIPVCANCHTFSNNGRLAMDIDYANDKGSYVIAALQDTVKLTFDKIITWSDYKREDGENTFGLLSQISPDGRHVLSTVKDRSVFVAVDNLMYSQLFFPIKGIIAVYDRGAERFYELEGAADKKFVQSNPNWSPDGREIMFSRAARYVSSKIENSSTVLIKPEDASEFISGQKEFKFDLCRLPFDEGRGGKAVPVSGASGNGKSNYFARYSPDGKWIVFCQAENFMLLQPDSRLYIMPAAGGHPRLMTCNTDQMNSWHSWSPNSKWIVFSSKSKGPYTQLYLTHIDENGDDSPPVFLESLACEKRAANIPEFFPANHGEFRKIVDEFSKNAVYYNRLAVLAINDDEYKSALNNISLAIQDDSTYVDAYVNRILINQKLGRSLSKADLVDRAIAQRLLEKQMRNNPSDKLLLYQRGNLRLLLDDYDGAVEDGLELIRSKTEGYKAYELITTGYQKLGQWDKAIACFQEMLTLRPGDKLVEYDLAIAYQETRQYAAALSLLNTLISRYPDESGLYISRAILLNIQGVPEKAKADFYKAVAADSLDYNVYYQRGMYALHQSSPEAAKVDFDKAVSLLTAEIDKNPQNAPLMIKKAEILEQSGDAREALTEYEAYSQVWGMSKIALNRIALIYYTQKEWQAAIDAYTAMINHFAGEAAFYYARSLAWQQMNDFARALQDADQAVGLAPADCNCLYQRARIKYELRDEAGYKRDLQASADLLHAVQKKRALSSKENEMLGSIGRLLKD